MHPSALSLLRGAHRVAVGLSDVDHKQLDTKLAGELTVPAIAQVANRGGLRPRAWLTPYNVRSSLLVGD